MPGLPGWNGTAPGRELGRVNCAAGDAGRAAGAQRFDEGALGRCRLAAVGAQEVHGAAHRLGALDLEADQLPAGELVLDDAPGDEANAEARGHRTLDGLVGIKLPALCRPIAGAGEGAIRDSAGTRPLLADEQGLVGQLLQRRPAASKLELVG